jgi:hypothetical protein
VSSKSVILTFYEHYINSGVWGLRGSEPVLGGCDFGSCPYAIFCMPTTNCWNLKTVPANPFLDLYFKRNQRAASSSSQWRLLCYPDLPRGRSPQWLWPSLGIPGSTWCPYRSSGQGGDCAGVSCQFECFLGFICAGYYPERFIYWFSKHFLGTYYVPSALWGMDNTIELRQ